MMCFVCSVKQSSRIINGYYHVVVNSGVLETSNAFVVNIIHVSRANRCVVVLRCIRRYLPCKGSHFTSHFDSARYIRVSNIAPIFDISNLVDQEQRYSFWVASSCPKRPILITLGDEYEGNAFGSVCLFVCPDA